MGEEDANLDDFICGFPSYRAEPLLEVTSITLKGKAGDALDSYITSNKKKASVVLSMLVYGQIYVCDGYGVKYFLYDRPRRSAESIPVAGGALTLQGLKNLDGHANVVMSMFAPLLSVDLKVKGNRREEDDAPFYQGTGDFGVPTLCHHEFNSLILSSDLGDVCVNYFAMPCATCVYLFLDVNEKEQSHQRNSPYGNVSGSVVASYKLDGVELRDPNQQIVLFKRISKRPQKVECGDDIMLSKSMLCLPMYASFLLDLNLHFKDFGPKRENFDIVECREFKASPYTVNSVKIQLPSGSGVFIRLYLSWRLPGFHGDVQLHKRPQASVLSIVRDSKYLMSTPQFEIFSVSVGRDWGKDELELYGRVQVVDSVDRYYLFQKDMCNPALLSRVNNILPLEGLKTYRDWLFMGINLMDIRGRVSCRGDVSISRQVDVDREHWCDRFLCSVVVGEHGYLAVHYAVFSSDVTSMMDFRLVPVDSGIELRYIRGTIAAYYSCFDYTTSHAKTYYGIVLYKSLEPQDFDMDKGLPLSRSEVAVPEGAFLIVDVDLYVTYSKGMEEHLKNGNIELKGEGQIEVGFTGLECNLKCFVKW